MAELIQWNRYCGGAGFTWRESLLSRNSHSGGIGTGRLRNTTCLIIRNGDRCFLGSGFGGVFGS